MGIKSTRTISRESAISRIIYINGLMSAKLYKQLEESTSEDDYTITPSLVDGRVMNLCNIDDWTDQMVEDKIDEPFFRFSMFDNYDL